LQPGPGFGGSCFPKDTLALKHMGRIHSMPLFLTEAVIHSNETHKQRMVDKIREALGGSVLGKCLGILGLAFKANTDDVRESSALVILNALLKAGAELRVHDPIVTLAKAGLTESGVTWANSPREAAEGAEALIVLTEWPEYLRLNWVDIRNRMKISNQKHPIVIDLRNLFSNKDMAAKGIHYISLGRTTILNEVQTIVTEGALA